MTLASAADSARDAAVMRALAHGPLAPTAELWIFLGAPLDRDDLAARVGMSERLARYFPSNAVVVRRAVFLAFDGEAAARGACSSTPCSRSRIDARRASDPGSRRLRRTGTPSSPCWLWQGTRAERIASKLKFLR